jgi:hypothetical protein
LNGKQAKRLRKQVKALNLPEKTTYTEGVQNLWGPLPYIEGTRVVDGNELKKRLKGAKNPKWQTILTSRTWYQRFVRYLPGKPIKMELCERQVYQQMKKKFNSEVA